MSVSTALVLHGVLLINVKRMGGKESEVSILNGTELVLNWEVQSCFCYRETSDWIHGCFWNLFWGCAKSSQMRHNGHTVIWYIILNALMDILYIIIDLQFYCCSALVAKIHSSRWDMMFSVCKLNKTRFC